MGMTSNLATSNLFPVGRLKVGILKVDMDMLIKHFKEYPEQLNKINSTFRKEKLDKIKDRINAKSDL